MNYLTLAIRVKYPHPDQFQKQTTWINIMYYSFGALNVLIPIIAFAINGSHRFVAAPLFTTVELLWIFTAGVLFVALIILKRSLDAEGKVTVNLKEMTIHFTAFALFLVACITYMILPIKSMFSSDPTVDLTSAINRVIVVIVIESVSGLILMRIFKKIYIVVNNRAEINALEDLNDSVTSYGPRPSLNGSREPEI